MKSILIIDTPTRCYDCPLFTDDEDDCHYGFCDNRNILKQKEAQEKVRFNEKPTWCPLRPLPKEEESADEVVELGSYNEGYGNGYECGFADGWNACLKEIQK